MRSETHANVVNRSAVKHTAKLAKKHRTPKSQGGHGSEARSKPGSDGHGGSSERRAPATTGKAAAVSSNGSVPTRGGTSVPRVGNPRQVLQGGAPVADEAQGGDSSSRALEPEPEQEPARYSQAVAAAIKTQRLKCLRRHFQGWRTHTRETTQNVVAFQTKATFRLLTCTWGIWKSHMHARHMKQKEGMLIAALANERKQLQIARDYNASRILANTFLAWQRWTRRRKWERDQADANQKKRAKMQKLLHVLQQRTVENSKKAPGDTATTNQQPAVADAPGRQQGQGQGHASPLKGGRVASTGSPRAEQGSKDPANPWSTSAAAAGSASLQDQRLLVMQRVKAGEVSIDEGLKQIADVDAQKAAAGPKTAKPRTPAAGVAASLDFVEDEVIMLQGANPTKKSAAAPVPVNPLVARMEERAAQRQVAKEVRVQRQKEKQAREEEAKEAEKQRLLQAAEQARRDRVKLRRLREQEAEAKKQAIEDKKRAAAEKETLADAHYRRALMRRYGWAPWAAFAQGLKSKLAHADEHHRCVQLRHFFDAWRQRTETAQQARIRQAVAFWREKTAVKCLRAWAEASRHRQGQNALARRFHKRNLIKRCLAKWSEFAKEDRARVAVLERRANAMAQNSRKRRAFEAWMRYIPEVRLEKMREQRRNALRAKVVSWLPDYVPRS